MNLIAFLAVSAVAILAVLAVLTRLGVRRIERRHPPAGDFATVDGTRMHFVHVPTGAGADLPPVVFLHGASANLLDQMLPVRPLLEGRAELLFPDRPGHGWSARGRGNETLFGQARTIAALMDRLGIADAVIVGHSFGGAVAAAFALQCPQRTRGLVFLSAATHPWPGAATNWYYRLSGMPVDRTRLRRDDSLARRHALDPRGDAQRLRAQPGAGALRKGGDPAGAASLRLPRQRPRRRTPLRPCQRGGAALPLHQGA